jgi:hypothetical protein
MRGVWLILALVAAGCVGGPDNGPPPVHPVSGKVLMADGKPAAGLEVTFLPTDAPMVPRIPRNPHAVTGEDGTFKVTTFQDGDGAAVGGYTVLLRKPPEKAAKADTAERQSEQDGLLGWYDAAHSTLRARVKEGANELPTITLRRITAPPPVSEGVPGRN